MKYDFDRVIDRINDPGSYSNKWADNAFVRMIMGVNGPMPEDRLAFNVADMDFACSPGIIASMKQVLDHGIFGYSGIDQAYYEAVVGWFKRRFDWEFTADDVYYAHGTHEGIADLIKIFTKKGDGVLLFTPSYGYQGDVESNGCHLVKIPFLLNEGQYSIDFVRLEEEAKKPENTMIILIQPHNPTGKIFTVEEIQKMGEICRANGVLIVSDEVHIDLTRDGHKIEPVMKVLGPQGVIAATAVNKTFNLAGLAVSNMIVADPVLKEKMRRNEMCSPFSIAALKGAYNDSDDWVDELNAYLDKCLHYVVDRLHAELPKIHVEYPEATYILWMDFKKFGLSDEELDARLFNNRHIMLGGGDWMDQLLGTQMRRMCVTSPMPMLKETLDRMVNEFKNL